MSLTSLDGVLPSTIKKLLAGELPGIKSSHISEGLAAGCGYRSNTAYMADLKAGHVRFVPVGSVDGAAMSERLTAILGTDLISTQNQVFGALARISMHVSGDIVPVGVSSLVAKEDVLEPLVHAHDTMVEAILDRLPVADTIHHNRRRRFLDAIIPAARWNSREKPKPAISMLINLMALDTFAPMSNVSYGRVPSRITKAVEHYLDSLPDYMSPLFIPDTTRVAHEQVIGDIYGVVCRLGNETPKDWVRGFHGGLWTDTRMSVQRHRNHVEDVRQDLYTRLAASGWPDEFSGLRLLVDVVLTLYCEVEPYYFIRMTRLPQLATLDALIARNRFPEVSRYLGTLSPNTGGAPPSIQDLRASHAGYQEKLEELCNPRPVDDDEFNFFVPELLSFED